jgi:hypothetical protein
MPDRWALPVGANSSMPSLSLSLSLSRCPMGQACRRRFSRPCPRFPLCPADPTCQPSLTSRPRSPHRGRTHVRTFSDHVPAPAPLLSPAPCSPTSPRSLAPSAEPPRPLSRSARATRAPPPPTDVCRPFYGRRGTPRRVYYPGKLHPITRHLEHPSASP